MIPAYAFHSAAGGAGIETLPLKNFVDMISRAVMRGIITSKEPTRKRLPEFGTVAKVVELLRTRKKIIVLTGAGVSTSCGIPDFRSKNGVYSMLGQFDLEEPVLVCLLFPVP